MGIPLLSQQDDLAGSHQESPKIKPLVPSPCTQENLGIHGKGEQSPQEQTQITNFLQPGPSLCNQALEE